MATSIDSVINTMGFGMFNKKVMLIIGLVWVMEGIEITLISLVSPKLKCEWNTSTFNTAVMTSSVFVGMGVGAAYWGWLGDKHGRRVMILTSAIFVLYFALLTSVTTNFHWFVLIRFFVGIGVGGITSAICYLVEFSTTPYRAKTVIAAQFFFAFGNVFAATMSYIAMVSLGWRWFVVLCATPLPFIVVSVPWLPESIRYLQNTGDYNGIMTTLFSISKENKVPLPNVVDIECKISGQRGNVGMLLEKKYFKHFVALVISWVVGQWAYFGIILMNTKILQTGMYTTHAHNQTMKCHVLTSHDYLQNLIVVFGEFPGLLFFFLVIEKLGRRKSLMLSFIATSICFFALFGKLSGKWFTVVMFLGRATSANILQILNVFTAEVFPTVIRNTALGICVIIGRCCLATLPFLIDLLIGTSFTILVAIFSVLTLLCSGLCLTLPETTGKELSSS